MERSAKTSCSDPPAAACPPGTHLPSAPQLHAMYTCLSCIGVHVPKLVNTHSATPDTHTPCIHSYPPLPHGHKQKLPAALCQEGCPKPSAQVCRPGKAQKDEVDAPYLHASNRAPKSYAGRPSTPSTLQPLNLLCALPARPQPPTMTPD